MEEVFTERMKEIVLQAAHTPLDNYTASISIKVCYTTSERKSADTLGQQRGVSHMCLENPLLF
jgi:hypothetical protein